MLGIMEVNPCLENVVGGLGLICPSGSDDSGCVLSRILITFSISQIQVEYRDSMEIT